MCHAGRFPGPPVCPLLPGGCPRSLPTAQSDDQAIVVEIAPIRFPRAREVFGTTSEGCQANSRNPASLIDPSYEAWLPWK